MNCDSGDVNKLPNALLDLISKTAPESQEEIVLLILRRAAYCRRVRVGANMPLGIKLLPPIQFRRALTSIVILVELDLAWPFVKDS